MKEYKPLRQGQPARTMPRTSLQDDQQEHDPAAPKSQSGTIQQLPLRAAPAMQNEFPMRKTRGRLSRDTLDKLGKVLEGFYDDVRKQGVPDRFTELLRQYEERKDKGPN